MDDEEHAQDSSAAADGGEGAAGGPRPYGRRRRGRRGGKGGAAEPVATAGAGAPPALRRATATGTAAPTMRAAGGGGARQRRGPQLGPSGRRAGGVKPFASCSRRFSRSSGCRAPTSPTSRAREGEYLEVRGPDLANLIGRHGNTLEALNLVFNNIVNAGVRNNRRYYTIDAEGYRARRADQLKGLALETLERAVRERSRSCSSRCSPRSARSSTWRSPTAPSSRPSRPGVEPDRRVVVSPKSGLQRRDDCGDRDASRRGGDRDRASLYAAGSFAVRMRPAARSPAPRGAVGEHETQLPWSRPSQSISPFAPPAFTGFPGERHRRSSESLLQRRSDFCAGVVLSSSPPSGLPLTKADPRRSPWVRLTGCPAAPAPITAPASVGFWASRSKTR